MSDIIIGLIIGVVSSSLILNGTNFGGRSGGLATVHLGCLPNSLVLFL